MKMHRTVLCAMLNQTLLPALPGVAVAAALLAALGSPDPHVCPSQGFRRETNFFSANALH